MQSDDPAIQRLHYPPGTPLWERSTEVASSPATAASPLVVYTQSTQLVGHLAAGHRRLSDYLNEASRSHLELTDVTIADLLAEPATTTRAGAVTLRKASIWLACPEDVPAPSSARVPTQQRAVTLVLGLFSVSGTLHRRSTDAAQLVQLFGGDSRRFVPLSRAQVRYLPNGRFDTEAAVLLVNTQHLDYWSTS